MMDLEILPPQTIQITVAESTPQFTIELSAQTGYIINIEGTVDPATTIQIEGQDSESLQLTYQQQPSLEFASQELTAEADQPILAGQPIYFKENGHAGLAIANDPARSNAIALATFETDRAGVSISYATDGWVERSNWGPITGYAALAPGASYFLSPYVAGALTSIAPTDPGKFVVKIGTALSDRRLAIEIQPSILL